MCTGNLSPPSAGAKGGKILITSEGRSSAGGNGHPVSNTLEVRPEDVPGCEEGGVKCYRNRGGRVLGPILFQMYA